MSKDLKRIFPMGDDSMALIVDDQEDPWRQNTRNLIRIQEC
jgi:hypothetical protein